ncbi:hypothetical protein SERLA73DRAFT_161086 [Serpula lacrymans var. lacrymans S7.3]|uniref:Uncharacterized protein n=1 Tax=Serpula lacrymans var. lacrymans (strain S7.3) TaxID=936435 RepID=F8Q1N5_SERL3|nr:hypothetical protein SERLA73DRAFT_161086 [Serpula lacrymans var. lacrymans S7.3]
MQAIWDVVYPDTTYQISMNCLVYHVLGQRVYKWQNGLSSLAQAMLEHLFDSMPHFKSQEARQVFAKSMLQDLAFLYEVVKSDSLVERVFTKQSQVILVGAEENDEDVVSDKATGSRLTGKSFLKPVPQLNAFSGKETTAYNNFSSTNWGSAARSYVTSIKSLQPAMIEDIHRKSLKYTKVKGKHVLLESDAEDVDVCTCIRDV